MKIKQNSPMGYFHTPKIIKFAIANLVIAGLVLISLSGSYANEPAQSEEYVWTGLYGGLNIGHGFQPRGGGTSSYRDPDAIIFPILDDTYPYDIAPSGVQGGLQIGYNHQIEGLVLGLELDFQGADMDDSALGGDEICIPVCGGSPGDGILFGVRRDVMARSTIDAFGTLRGRLGFSNGPLMAYATVGLIFANVEHSVNVRDSIEILCTPFPNCLVDEDLAYSGSRADWKPGLVVGAGLEYMVWKNLSIKVEYLFYNLDNTKFNSALLTSVDPGIDPFLPDEIENTFQNTGNIIRIGANWRFWTFN
jgi:outer membrane immunogenic protein